MAGVHALVGFAAVGAVLVFGLQARGRVRSGRAFDSIPYRWVAVLVDVQVALGAAAYVIGAEWEREDWHMYVHLAVGVAAVALLHFGIRRARDERWAAEAYGIVGRTFLAVLVLQGVAVWAALAA